jgi:hypothetical protein
VTAPRDGRYRIAGASAAAFTDSSPLAVASRLASTIRSPPGPCEYESDGERETHREGRDDRAEARLERPRRVDDGWRASTPRFVASIREPDDEL